MSNIALKIINFSRQKVEFLVLLVGALLLYILTQIGYWSAAIPVSGIIVGAIVSIVLSLFEKEPVEMEHSMVSAGVNYKISIIIASAYISSLIILYRFQSYQKPIIHYIIFGGYTGYIGYEILTNRSRYRVLPQIVTLCFFTYWSNQFAFPAGSAFGDTLGDYVPLINQVLSDPTPSFDIFYQSLGAFNLSYVAIFKIISGLEVFTSYALLATLVLTGTMLVISLISHVLPRISRQVVLFAALIFGSSSWMLGRGFRPNKLNFFYILILLLGICFLALFQTTNQRSDWRWGLIGTLIGVSLIFGHRFSAGSGLFLLVAIAIFAVLRRTILAGEYPDLKDINGFSLIAAYFLGLILNPFHEGPLLGRLSDMILTLVAPRLVYSGSGSAGGPGRYSGIQLDVLAFSTAPQVILFLLVIIGFTWAYKQAEWEYDVVTVWITIISIFLMLSVVRNTIDTVPQRFYSLLVLFGFNLLAGVAFKHRINQVRPSYRKGIIICVVVILAMVSLASPVANQTTSVVSDEIPNSAEYTTNQFEQGSDWVQKYSNGGTSPLPVDRTGPTDGTINITRLESSNVYMYSKQVMTKTGYQVVGGRGLGSREYVFLSPPNLSSEAVTYSNGDVHIITKGHISSNKEQ